MSTPLLPVQLDVAGRLVVVVGGGPVAARRALAAVEAGGVVVVVAPWACEDVVEAAQAGRLDWWPRDYVPGDLDGAWFAHAATGDHDVDAAVSTEAESRRVFCVNAGDAAVATAWVPAVARADGVVVSVGSDRPTPSPPHPGDHASRVRHGDPRRVRRLRDAIATALDTGDLPLRPQRRSPGPGRVALVGGGPGDVGLLTTRGRRLLARADVVVVDALAPRGVLADLDDDVLVVDVGKTPGHHLVPQEEINRVLVEHALAGRDVVRLKGGDPYVLGRGGEERAACEAAGVAVEVVPGVTSAVSVPAAAGIPVTHRGVARGFSVVSAHEELGDVPGGAEHTLVLLMGVARLRESCATLVAGGRAEGTPVAVVEDGYGPRQRTTTGTLADVADRAEAVGVRSPAVVVVGDVVTLSPAWPPVIKDGAHPPPR